MNPNFAGSNEFSETSRIFNSSEKISQMSGVPFIIKDKNGGKKFLVGAISGTTLTMEYKEFSADDCADSHPLQFLVPDSLDFADPGGNFSIPQYLSGQTPRASLYAGQTYYPQFLNTTSNAYNYLVQTKSGSDVYTLAPITSNPGPNAFGVQTYAIGTQYNWSPQLTVGITTNFGQITFYNAFTSLTETDSILFDYGPGCLQGIVGPPINLSVSQCTGVPNSCAVCGPNGCVTNYTCTSIGGGPCASPTGCNCTSTTATGATLFTFGLRWTNTSGTVYVLTYSTPSGGKTHLFAVPEDAVPTQDLSGSNLNTGSNTNGTIPSEKWFTVIVPSGQTSLQSGVAYPIGVIASNGTSDVIQYLNKGGTFDPTTYTLESSPGSSNFTLTPQNNVDWFDFGLATNSLSNGDFTIIGGNSTTGTSFAGTIALWNISTLAGQAAVGENPLSITSPPSGAGFSLNINTPFSLNLVATGGSGTYSWTVSGLPPGLCLLLPNNNCVSPDTQSSTNGLISGTPSESIVIPPSGFAQFFAVIGVTDSDGNTATNTIELDVFASTTLSVVTTTLPNAFVGLAYTATLVGSGGTGSYNWTATGLPPNLSLNATTGVISGTPTTAGTSTINVTLTDNSTPMQTATATLTLTVVQPGSTTLTLSPTTLPQATTNQAYSQTITVTNSSAGPFTWTIASGTLPSQFSTTPPIGGQGNNFVISGTPTSVETETFTLQAVDTNNNIGQQSYTLSVDQPGVTIVISPNSLPGGIVGTTYNQVLTATPALTTGSYTWTVSSGSLPPGITGSSTTSNTFTLTGNPTTAGSFSFTILATDPNGNPQTQIYTLTIAAASTPQPSTTVPFFREWWFWVIVAVVVILIIIIIVYLIYRRR